ncbi:MAG: CRISPR-associated endoribonuclease Cas6, partial [Bacteroidota bacterium]
PTRYHIGKKDRTFTLVSSPTTIELSFYMDEALQHFIVGLFTAQTLKLSSGGFSVEMEVGAVEVLPSPNFSSTMRFRTLTPICIGQDEVGTRHAQYRSPESVDYADLLLRNLLRKEHAVAVPDQVVHSPALDLSFDYAFQLCSSPRSKLLTFRGNRYRGFLFDFLLSAPIDLLKIGYFAGFGEKNSNLGMGMVEVIR